MMDSMVEEKLTEWGLEVLIKTFEENQIDEQVFRDLTLDDIKELIPILGLRKKFLLKFEEEKRLNEACLHPIVIETDNNSDVISLAGSTTASTSAYSTDSEIEIEVSTDAKHRNLRSLHCYTEKATLGLPFKILPIPDATNSVKALLDTSEEGKLIYASYGKNKTFRRGDLARLIVKNELQNSCDKSISTERFIKLANEIYEIFLHESPQTYYTPYVQSSSKAPVSASGKLWSAYISARRDYRTLGLIGKAKDKNLESIIDPNISLKSEEYILWLKNNNEPFVQVCEYWRKTLSQRTNNNLKNGIGEYFKTFPCLNQPLGYLLLESDFNQLYPDKENIFFATYLEIAPKIFQLLKSKTDPFIKENVKAFLDGFNNVPSEDEICLFTLKFLPLLLQAPLKSKGSVRWKPSKVELQEGFILQTKDSADLKPALERRAAKYLHFKLTAQPVPVLVGTLELTSYVSINQTLYKVETPMKAVELCFKVFHALNANYPYEAEAAWIFIQKSVYKIKTKFDKNFTSVNTLISDIALVT